MKKFIINLSIRGKILGSFILFCTVIVLLSGLSIRNLSILKDNTTSLYNENTIPIENLGKSLASLYQLRGDVYKYLLLPDQREKVREAISQDIIDVNIEMDAYIKHGLTNQEQIDFELFSNAWKDYQNAIENIIKWAENGDEGLAMNSLIDGEAHLASKELDTVMNTIIVKNESDANLVFLTSNQTYRQLILTFIAFSLGATLLALLIGVWISRNISRSLSFSSSSALHLAVGDLNRHIDQSEKDKYTSINDESGAVAKGLRGIEQYLAKMVLIAQKLAEGDLAIEVSPYSENDELGNVFSKMIVTFRKMVSQINENAGQLSTTSSQLAHAANESGEAASQMAETINQISDGTTQQANSINQTVTTIDQMSNAIEGVAQGAQNQNREINRTAEITANMSSSIQKVADNAKAGVDGSKKASEVAQNGSEIVKATIDAMDMIQTKVKLSALKVEEMGNRSKEIGVIVETIDDIASQTNLLALNAAIEAARAGEHGKGFAVVADEVRKLAERSSAATKEINDLVTLIQNTVTDSIVAMNEGSTEVEKGVLQANQAGASLFEILNASEQVNQQVNEIASSADDMMGLSNELTAANDSVSAIVEENTAATEQMAAGSNEITRSIENIASISEENSAAIEEINASAYEMSSQVEDVANSVQQLNNMASDLQAIVNQFRLSENEDISQKVELFKQAHLRWVDRLNDMVAGKVSYTEDQLGSHHNCILGKWYYGRGSIDFGTAAAFQLLEDPHIRLHKEVVKTVQFFNQNNIEMATQSIAIIEEVSREIVNLLDQMEEQAKKL
ncbi:MAG: MCP four helix bundle domain-containing protein [Anaerolineaceae bacterium]|nr:MCP four helix bundle domain-containing protein [Anaerolineaceae bacterium]